MENAVVTNIDLRDRNISGRILWKIEFDAADLRWMICRRRFSIFSRSNFRCNFLKAN